MTGLQILNVAQGDRWRALLERTAYDFYHLPEYHALAEAQGEGKALLFVYERGDHTIALPLLLRAIKEVPGLGEAGKGWWDATSVYGYAGPVATRADLPPALLEDFRTRLREALRERRVVSVFTRLHPLLSQQALIEGLGRYVPNGRTVSIDLSLPVEVQRAQYRTNHKRDINKLKRAGGEGYHDRDKQHLDAFIDIYYETMTRVGADEAYFFDRDYFERLVSSLDTNMQLFFCRLDGQLICGGLFGACNGFVQYHLGGTRDAFYDLAPIKLLFDTVRLWANARGAHVFHLGGGVNARQDSLFRFKAGFTEQQHEFATWRWVLRPDVYAQLCREKNGETGQDGGELTTDGYFPTYRRPVGG